MYDRSACGLRGALERRHSERCGVCVWVPCEGEGVRQRAKRDANESEVVAALERVGAVVYRISASGLPDLLCCFRGRWTPMEVKSGKGKLTEAQAATFMQTPFAIVRDREQALKAIGALKP